MLKVEFYDRVDDTLLEFAVIVCKSKGKWVLCKHRERNTYEFPGGHREEGEDILSTARRELYEETGAVVYAIKPLCAYSVDGFHGIYDDSNKSYGMLYYADIMQFEELPMYEIETVILSEQLPENWTYPEIQPILLQKIKELKEKYDKYDYNKK